MFNVTGNGVSVRCRQFYTIFNRTKTVEEQRLFCSYVKDCIYLYVYFFIYRQESGMSSNQEESNGKSKGRKAQKDEELRATILAIEAESKVCTKLVRFYKCTLQTRVYVYV